jgi:hypothetical protein
MLSNTDFVSTVYQQMLLRGVDTTGLSYYVSRLDSGLATRAQVVESLLYSNEITQVPTSLSSIFQAVLGRMPDKSGLAFWNQITQTGASLAQVAQQLIGSDEFKQKNTTTTNDAILGVIYQNALGRAPDAAGSAYWKKALTTGATLGDVAANIALSAEGHARNDTTILKDLTWHAVVGSEPTTAQLTALPTDKSALASAIMQVPSVNIGPGNFWVSNFSLYGNGDVMTGLVVADLTKNTLTMNGVSQVLAAGDMSLALNADFSTLGVSATSKIDSKTTPQLVSVIGDDNPNTIIGCNYGNLINAGKGDDTITLGTGIDSVVFASTAANNGVDTINGFTLGKGGDVLNFAAFLNSTGKANLVTKLATSTASAAWSNGDVLVVQGDSITTSAGVAALFSTPTVGAVTGTNSVFAAPTAQAKAVVIVSDVIGNATVWYVTNQNASTITTIDATEASQVAILTGINNLALVGVTSDNFA